MPVQMRFRSTADDERIWFARIEDEPSQFCHGDRESCLTTMPGIEMSLEERSDRAKEFAQRLGTPVVEAFIVEIADFPVLFGADPAAVGLVAAEFHAILRRLLGCRAAPVACGTCSG